MSSKPDWIFGINPVEGALEHDTSNVTEILLEQGAQNPRLRELAGKARDQGIPVHARTREQLDRLTGGARHQGAVAGYRKPQARGEQDLATLASEAGAEALFLVLDGVQDPHNLGACLRSAEAAGATAVVVPKDRAVGITPIVRKASAGAADRVPLLQVTNLARAMQTLRDAGVWITGLTGDAEKFVHEVDLRGAVALVLGGEAEGMRRLTRERCDFLARIPMRGTVESLNVSVAAGVVLFEALRQRGTTNAIQKPATPISSL